MTDTYGHERQPYRLLAEGAEENFPVAVKNPPGQDS